MSWYSALSTEELVARLQLANYQYHNTETILMSDDDYDKGLAELARRSPQHPFLSVIGAPGAGGGSLLPVVLGSLDKVRHGEGGLDRWIRRQSGVKRFVVMEKLDGLSALLVRRPGSLRMYLRGDGVKGVEVPAWAVKTMVGAGGNGRPCMIRGEILLANSDVPEGSIGRSLVNGWMHRQQGPAGAAETPPIQFVAYQVLGGEAAEMTRSKQLSWLQKEGYKTPWSALWVRAAVTEDFLKKALVERKGASEFPLDGLVIGTDDLPPQKVGGGEAKNPGDAVAFKASLEDQKAETEVVGIEWNVSRQGILVPRIEIRPVQVGGATIRWLSGHNAALIETNGIGVGARICIRRSGDVIPTVDEVLKAAAKPGLPEGQGEVWEWDENHVHAVQKVEKDVDGKGLLHGLQTLGVEGIGPGLVKKMVDAGICDMKTLWTVKEDVLGKVIGPGRAGGLLKSLRECREKATMSVLLQASNKMPRGVGERKLRALFEKEEDVRKWSAELFSGSGTPSGWTEASLSSEFWESLKKAQEWIAESFPGAAAATVAPKAPEAPKAQTQTKFCVFTGVRDKALEALLPSKGWSVEDSVSKKVSAVIVADGPEGAKPSGKTKKAESYGIQILPLAQFRAMILGEAR